MDVSYRNGAGRMAEAGWLPPKMVAKIYTTDHGTETLGIVLDYFVNDPIKSCHVTNFERTLFWIWLGQVFISLLLYAMHHRKKKIKNSLLELTYF